MLLGRELDGWSVFLVVWFQWLDFSRETELFGGTLTIPLITTTVKHSCKLVRKQRRLSRKTLQLHGIESGFWIQGKGYKPIQVMQQRSKAEISTLNQIKIYFKIN